MQAVTWFLLELAGALVLGHMALFFAAGGPRIGMRRAHASSAAYAAAEGEAPVIEGKCTTIGSNGHKMEDRLRELIASQRALAEKVAMAHQRLAEIERSSVLREAQTDRVLRQKLSKLDNFRANTEVELTGLKEVIERIEKSPAATKTEKYKKKIEAVDKDLKDLEKDLHRLVFRSKGMGS